MVDDKNEMEQDILRYFAGCGNLNDEINVSENIEEVKEEDEEPTQTPEMAPYSKKIAYVVFFPNNFSGYDYFNNTGESNYTKYVDVGEEKGVIENLQKEMINNIFEFDDIDVSDIMTHRTDMVAVEDTDTLKDVVDLSIEHGYSRIPVYHEDQDNIIGIVYIKDLLKYISSDNFPESVKWYLDYALTITDDAKEKHNYSKENMSDVLVGMDIASKIENIETCLMKIVCILQEFAFDKEQKSTPKSSDIGETYTENIELFNNINIEKI